MQTEAMNSKQGKRLMNQSISGRWIAVLFVLCGWLLLSGHQSVKVDAQDATPTPESTPDGTTSDEFLTFGPGSLILGYPSTGLDGLSSYKAILKIAFKGKKDNKPNNWSKTYTMLFTKEPLTRQLTVEKTGDPAATLFLAERDGAA